jgi:hypothetical protein
MAAVKDGLELQFFLDLSTIERSLTNGNNFEAHVQK